MVARDAAERARVDGQFRAALKSFETATRLFQKRNYDKAKELFEKLAEGPVPEIAERARVHSSLCEQRLRSAERGPKTADELYTMGVAELNARNLDQAIEYLNKADKMSPSQEHIRYALAAAHAVRGNVETALEHLKASIALRSKNRAQARHDQDFAALAADSRFKRLISSDVLPES